MSDAAIGAAIDMGESPGDARLWIRPGVIFWKGTGKAFLEDPLHKRKYAINDNAYLVLKNCNGRTRRELLELVGERCPGEPGEGERIIDFLDGLVKEDLVLFEPPTNFISSSYPLGVVFFELTRGCNLRCRTCYNEAGIPIDREMTTREWQTIIERVAALEPVEKRTLLLTGGEPLYRRDFFEIASHARKAGLGIQLFSNGTLIDEKMADRIAELDPEYIRISLDGATPETNDYIRGEGSYLRTLQAMEHLVDRGLRVCWQAVISRQNFHELGAMLEKAVALGLDGFKASSIDAIGRGTEIEALQLPAEHEFALWKFLEQASHVHEGRIKIGMGADYCLDSMVLEKSKQPLERESYLRSLVVNSICGVGCRSLLIDPSGNISLCPLLTAPELRMGHALEDDLATVWSTGAPLLELKGVGLDDFEECGSCGFRYSCLGGCRGLAYAATGSLQACDPKRKKGYGYFASIGERPVET